MSGTIADGAAYPKGATVEVVDSTGATVCTTTLASDDGAYTCTIPTSAKLPLVVTASAEDKEPMVSVVGDLTSSTINVNPATRAVAALLVNGDPTDSAKGIAALIKTDASIASASKVAEKQQAVLETYKQLAPEMMQTAANPFTGKLTTDGKGMDAVLDVVKIVVTPTGDGKAELAISTNIQRDDATPAPEPMKLTLSGTVSTAAPALSTVVTATEVAKAQVTTANQVAEGTTGQIADLLKRITACYAEPQATRVSGNNIVSTACKGIFLDNDPTKYQNNGYKVGPNKNSNAWSGIYLNDTGLGVQFSQGNYEYTVKSDNTDPARSMKGDVVLTAKWEAPFDYADAAGTTTRLSNSGVDIYTARPDATGKLFLTGNLSGYDISVEPRAELRNFIHSSMKQFSYINTGYNIFVNSNNNLGKVVVTPPNSTRTFTLKRLSSGFGYMGLATSTTTVATTGMVRMAAQYLDSTLSSINTCGASDNHPSAKESNMFWTCKGAEGNADWTDDALSKIPEQGTWKFDLYEANGTTLGI